MSSVVAIPRLEPYRETYVQRGWRKCKEQPLVPIGIVATCVALIGATKHLRAGDRTNFNRFLRFRVLAQGITVAACVAGTLVYGHYDKKEKDTERLRDQAELAAYQTAVATATEPMGPPPSTSAQKRTEESIEELVARAEAMEKAQARRPSARDTLMAALLKQKAEKAEWARQKEQSAAENKQ
ncbi:hypothetical protein CTheo_4803 [Ceratobasidium theobromae]|uniref:HIG1 domain-containing protein n=1 Tax=Ceratobasidium theobromae TaxID=1582974 RepID=A0A5N5QJX9_9AGAM|nr:hypothetical protein CTheo_4803 [Ceratobasidium theobromae]